MKAIKQFVEELVVYSNIDEVRCNEAEELVKNKERELKREISDMEARINSS